MPHHDRGGVAQWSCWHQRLHSMSTYRGRCCNGSRRRGAAPHCGSTTMAVSVAGARRSREVQGAHRAAQGS
eukprot:7576671-Alexandrium_andersonii.AAC.1